MALYRLLLTLIAPALVARALWRRLRGRDDAEALRDRLLGPPAPNRAVWLHGASNGELASARPLIARLARPARPLLVTANTPTGRDLVRGWGLPHVSARIAPLDLRASTRRPLRNAAALILLENELWPNRIGMAAARGLPVLLLGARISSRSARGWARIAGLAERLLGAAALIAPQDADSAGRLAALGAPADRLAPPLQLKSLYRPARGPVPADLAAAYDRPRTLLAAATHAGEEAIVLDAFRIALASEPALRLILAPRHPARAPEIAALAAARGLGVARRSAGDPPCDPPSAGPSAPSSALPSAPVAPAGASKTPRALPGYPAEAGVYLADTMGEMEWWYALAGAAFVGGSLVPLGGHTPFEPAALGCAILHGPHVANFAAEYGRLDAGGGAAPIADAETLGRAFLAHRSGSPLPERARALLAPEDAGALLERIEALL